MGETNSESFSISKEHSEWLDKKKKENPSISKSYYIQAGLDILISKDKNNGVNLFFMGIVTILVGITILFFILGVYAVYGSVFSDVFIFVGVVLAASSVFTGFFSVREYRRIKGSTVWI